MKRPMELNLAHAERTLAGYIARRDHSKKELYTKLSKKGFAEDIIEEAISNFDERGWIVDPEELSLKVSKSWDRKNKSYLWIQNYLREKGLPEQRRKPEVELEKIEKQYSKKFTSDGLNERADKNKVFGYLASRGFLTEDIYNFWNNRK